MTNRPLKRAKIKPGTTTKKAGRSSFKENKPPYLSVLASGDPPRVYRKKQLIFSQGDAADSVYFIQEGKVKLSVVSGRGREAVVAMLEPGSFFGEGCLAGQPVRMSTAAALQRTQIVRIDREKMIAMLKDGSGYGYGSSSSYAESFIQYLLTRNIRIEEDLVDQLFNSSEKRLARLLLTLAHYGKDSKPEPIVPDVSQETLAMMIGTTRSRVSQFMNKFRKLGMIDYNGSLYVNQALLSSVLRGD